MICLSSVKQAGQAEPANRAANLNKFMKKLNLQLGSIKEMLTKEQMKKVSGGYVCVQPFAALFVAPGHCQCRQGI
jgi:hypothetical protein